MQHVFLYPYTGGTIGNQAFFFFLASLIRSIALRIAPRTVLTIIRGLP